MPHLGRIASVLAVALITAALPIEASAQPRASTRTTGARITRLVASPGTYRVSVAVTTRADARVLVRIGDVSTPVAIERGHGNARLTARLGGHSLTVAVFGFPAAPRLAVTGIRRVRDVGRAHHSTQPSHRSSPPSKKAAPAPAAPREGTSASGSSTPSAAGSTVVAPSASNAAVGSAAAPASAATAGSPASTAATGAAGPPGGPASWRIVFDDEFNGTQLDTSLWSTGWMGSGITAPVNPEELECYDPAQVSEGGGELDLTLIAKSETCGGTTRPYASGMIDTAGKFSYTYGYLEARVWVPGNGAIADWPAVWTDGQNWPQDGELDAMEGLGGQACWHFHDPAGAPGGCAAGTFTGGWHTFGADWEPGSVTYYYDGTAVGSVTSGVTASPMFVILDLAADTTYGGPIAAPATMRVDYVRVWQH